MDFERLYRKIELKRLTKTVRVKIKHTRMTAVDSDCDSLLGDYVSDCTRSIHGEGPFYMDIDIPGIPLSAEFNLDHKTLSTHLLKAYDEKELYCRKCQEYLSVVSVRIMHAEVVFE